MELANLVRDLAVILRVEPDQVQQNEWNGWLDQTESKQDGG